MSRPALLAAALLTLAATAAQAHPGIGVAGGFASRVRASARRYRSCPGDGRGRPVRRAARGTGAVAGAAVVCRDDGGRRRCRDGRGRAASGRDRDRPVRRRSRVCAWHAGIACRSRPRWRWPGFSRCFMAMRTAPRCRNRYRAGICGRFRAGDLSAACRRDRDRPRARQARRGVRRACAADRRKRDCARRGRDPLAHL